jgi:putative transcriptional regulator
MGDGRGNSPARANPSSLARGTHARAFERAGDGEVAGPAPADMLALAPPRMTSAMALTFLQRLGSMLAGMFLCASLVHAALPTAAGKPKDGSLTGQLLIASPSMGDPRFLQTVILMVRHDRNGALGIVINRPIGDRPLASLLAALGDNDPAVAGTVRIFAGGPVEPDIGFVVHSSDYRRPDTLDIDGGLAMTSSREILRDIGNQRGPAKSLIAFGYAGWAAGQLEGELAQGFWFTTPQDGSLVFDDDRDEVWDHAMKRRTQDL